MYVVLKEIPYIISFYTDNTSNQHFLSSFPYNPKYDFSNSFRYIAIRYMTIVSTYVYLFHLIKSFSNETLPLLQILNNDFKL